MVTGLRGRAAPPALRGRAVRLGPGRDDHTRDVACGLRQACLENRVRRVPHRVVVHIVVHVAAAGGAVVGAEYRTRGGFAVEQDVKDEVRDRADG